MELLEKLDRDTSSHKGENGKLGVIGGSRDFTGAPALSAEAALRTGADLTEILTSEQAKNIVAGYSENFIVRAYASGYLEESGLEKALMTVEWSDATVLGPGLGNPDPEVVEKIVSKAGKPLVIDADAIRPALEADISDAILTPHSSEAEMIEEEFGSIEDFVDSKENVSVVVKGETDKIYTPDDVYENDTGHPAMTVGGTGDVLTGIIGSLIGQGLSLDEAARLGTWINGRAGEKAAEEYDNGALATDLVEKIPEVMDQK